MTSFRNPGIVNQALKNGWINNTYEDEDQQYLGYTFNPQKQSSPVIYNPNNRYGPNKDAHDIEVEKALSTLYGNYISDGRLQSQNNALQTMSGGSSDGGTNSLTPYDLTESLYSKIINGGDIPKQQVVESFQLPKVSRKERFEEDISTSKSSSTPVANNILTNANTPSHSVNVQSCCMSMNQQTISIIIVVALLIMFGFIIYTSVQNTQSQRRIEMLLDMNMRNRISSQV